MRSPLLTLALLATSAFAQTPTTAPQEPPSQDAPQTSTLSVQVRVVAIDAVVRDKQTSAPVLDLTKDDFDLRVDNHPTPIRYFSHDNDLPPIRAQGPEFRMVHVIGASLRLWRWWGAFCILLG